MRDGGERFVAQHGYAALATFEDHKRDPAEMGSHELEAVLDAASLKLIVRHASLTPRQLLAEVQALKLSGFAVTHSGAPFLEVLAEGVSKAWGLEQLCRRLGIEAAEVLAFGDAPNDAELLTWAGRGVAVANAEPEALTAASEVTLSNDEDGVAVVINGCWACTDTASNQIEPPIESPLFLLFNLTFKALRRSTTGAKYSGWQTIRLAGIND